MTILGAGGDGVRVLQRDADDELAGPVPQIGEPEDVIDEVPLLKSKTGIGPYYQIIPRKEPDDPARPTTEDKYAGCQPVELDIRAEIFFIICRAAVRL
jgi:hypothetical protein